MTINYSTRLDTYVAQDEYGVVAGIYNASEYGSLEEFRHAMGVLNVSNP